MSHTTASNPASAVRRFWQRIGPGLLMAGAAIGVSHLVQATRAGADFGTQLIGVVVLIHVLKYPFFEYGHRYAAATGESLLHGYARLGRGYLMAFMLLVGVSAVITVAGVTFVAAGLAQNLLEGPSTTTAWAAMLIAACTLLLVVGHYRILEGSMRIIMIALMLTTAVALVAVIGSGARIAADPGGPSAFQLSSLGFLIALMGWMPAPIEGAAFQSLWVRERDRTKGARATLGDVRVDFNNGYAVTLVAAVLFLLLGAYVMHGRGIEFADTAGGFAAQFVDLYIRTLGPWAEPIVATAALTTMFSTLLAIYDAYPRSIAVGLGLVRGRSDVREGSTYWVALVLIGSAALVILHAFIGSLRALIDLATTLAFLSAPVLGWLNFRLLTSRHTPVEMQPGRALRALSWVGLTFFGVLGVLFVVHRFLPGRLGE